MSAANLYEQRVQLFPQSTQVDSQGGQPGLAIGGARLDALAEEYGTPLYIYDQAELDRAAEEYRHALKKHYPGQAGITYAGKAFLCLAMAEWVQHRGLTLDCTGAGELHIAGAANVARKQTLVHGVNKSPHDLDAALAQAGTIVVDNLTELNRLAAAYRVQAAIEPGVTLPELWLRIRPGVAVETHAYTQTGQEDSKFGMSLAETMAAVKVCLDNHLPLKGLHFHQGSHFHDPAPLEPAMQAALDLAVDCREQTGWQPEVICPGGGWGVPYHEDDLPHSDAESYVARIAEALVKGCEQRGLKLPKLQLEPGRSIVARAGVAVYRVGAIKHTAERRWVLLDGGMADNPRPALYGARYSALPVLNPERAGAGPAWLGGPYCESGDILIHNLPLAEVKPGEWIAVPVSGAYQLSMGSNYNGARRPAVVWLSDGQAHIIQQRETLDGLLQRDHSLQAVFQPEAG
jgi:diaminopimelate decarboxylase